MNEFNPIIDAPRQKAESEKKEITDIKLIQKILADSTGTLFEQEIIRKYGKQIRNICSKYTRDTNHAMFFEDIVQSALITIQEKLSSFRGDSALGNWIAVVTKNACIGFLERQQKIKKNTKVIPFASLPEISTRSILSPGYIDDANDTEPDFDSISKTGFAQKLITDRAFLAEVFGENRPKGKDLFIKYYIEGKTYQQISNERNLPVNQIRSTLTKIRAYLYDYYQNHYRHLKNE